MNTTIETVGVVAFDKTLEKVLLVKHLAKAEHESDKYGIPAGRLESNQTLAENAIRELKEETGLISENNALEKLPFEYEADIPRKDGFTKHFRLETFLCKGFSGDLVGDDENEPVWTSLEQLNSLDLLPNVRKIVQDALDYIEKSSQLRS
ncbi:MAG: NUDIX domain-containing protein [Patescibacteria group bacterium]|nr:NUDIX domain-containing protein [Patescibacteria group bacterium]